MNSRDLAGDILRQQIAAEDAANWIEWATPEEKLAMVRAAILDAVKNEDTDFIKRLIASSKWASEKVGLSEDVV